MVAGCYITLMMGWDVQARCSTCHGLLYTHDGKLVWVSKLYAAHDGRLCIVGELDNPLM